MKPWIQSFTVGVGHTISTAPYENLKIEASITIGVHAEATEEEYFMLRQAAHARLRELIVEIQAKQRRRTQATENLNTGDQHG